MRLFVALDIDEEIRTRVADFVEQVRTFAPDVRWVNVESLHVTLKFIGETPDDSVKSVEQVLAEIESIPLQMKFGGAGFFPTAKAARVFWVGIQADQELGELAKKIEHGLAGVGIPKEQRAFSAHLTLARAAGGSGAPAFRRGDKPNRQFALLQEHLQTVPAPEFGTMTAREFFLYRSQLSNKGSRYTKIARFPLSDR